MTRAAARAYDQLQAEFAADERRAIEAAGGIAPNVDGTPRGIIQGKLATTLTPDGAAPVNLYRARCSCGFEGREYVVAHYESARAELRSHRCGGDK